MFSVASFPSQSATKARLLDQCGRGFPGHTLSNYGSNADGNYPKDPPQTGRAENGHLQSLRRSNVEP